MDLLTRILRRILFLYLSLQLLLCQSQSTECISTFSSFSSSFYTTFFLFLLVLSLFLWSLFLILLSWARTCNSANAMALWLVNTKFVKLFNAGFYWWRAELSKSRVKISRGVRLTTGIIQLLGKLQKCLSLPSGFSLGALCLQGAFKIADFSKCDHLGLLPICAGANDLLSPILARCISTDCVAGSQLRRGCMKGSDSNIIIRSLKPEIMTITA